MKSGSIQTSILASSLIGAALLTIGALGFSAPTGEMSKLQYSGNLWCVSNWIEEQDASGKSVNLPDPDGRAQKDHRLQGKEDWLRMDQVEAESKEEAEQKATRDGLFDPSEKTALREALDKGDKTFFTSHFNSGATAPGPCLGSGTGSGMVGKWINDAIREDCFDIEPTSAGEATTDTGFSSGKGGVCIGGNAVPEEYAKIFQAAGQKFGVNPAWIAAIFAAENGLAYMRGGRIVINSSARWPSINRSWRTSSAGAMGPMQFMPGTWPGHAQDGNGDGKKDVQNVYDAIFAGAHYIKNTANVSSENPPENILRRSAIAYNAGPGRVNRTDDRLPVETRAYILKTREAFKRYNCP